MKIKATPELACLSTRARIAKINARNVEATAASDGLLPNGIAIKSDQLARERPRTRCTSRMRAAFVDEKIRKCHTIATMIQAGR